MWIDAFDDVDPRELGRIWQESTENLHVPDDSVGEFEPDLEVSQHDDVYPNFELGDADDRPSKADIEDALGHNDRTEKL